MNSARTYLPALAPLALAIAACASPTKTEQKKVETDVQNARQLISTQTRVDAPDRVRVTPKVIIPVVPKQLTSAEGPSAWLVQKTISLQPMKAVSLTEIVKIISSQGVNITSSLPLESYFYSGYGINNTDANTALKMVLGSVGLDYELDNLRRVVVVKPMSGKTWYLNLGNRKSSYTSGNLSSTMSSSLAANGTNQTQNQQQGTSDGTTGTGTASSDNFWDSLKTELTNRLSVMVPATRASSGPQPMAAAAPTTSQPLPAPGTQQGQAAAAPTQAANNSGPALYVSKQIGTFSINPVTGAVNVQAPNWILAELDTYLTRVQEMYNTDLTFSGEVLMLSTSDQVTEATDIASIGRLFNTKYNLAVSNNSLGGITILQPGTSQVQSPQIFAGTQPIANTLFGITNQANTLQIFSNYLSSFGTVSVLQRPVMSTSSGVPVEFSKVVTSYFNTVTQQTSAGNTGAASVGTQNTLVPVDLGTTIKINPRFDVSTGIIRAQISLFQTIRSGDQTVQQQLSGAGGAIQQVSTPIPILTKMNYTGETMVRDGDTIIVGGQTDDSADTSDSGLTGLKDTPVGGLFGQRAFNKRRTTYYFALRVSVFRRDKSPSMNNL